MADVITISSSDDESCASNLNPKIIISASNHLQNNFNSLQIPSSSTSTDRNQSFQEFISACQVYINDAKGLQILNRLQETFKDADVIYTSSSEFFNFLMDVGSKIKLHPENIFIYIKNLYDELKAKKSARLTNITVKVEKRPSNNVKEQAIVDQAESEVNSAEEKTNLWINRLENLLRKLDKKIKKLENREISLDDMNEDSAYLREDRYKKRFVEVWNKLCKLKQCSTSAGRYCEKKFVYKGSRFPEINKMVSKYINVYKQFPDFQDTLQLITKVSEKHRIRLRPLEIQDLAKTVFSEVGALLRKRRILDLTESLEIADSNEDPADHDKELADTLEKSTKQGQEKIDHLIEEYVQKQMSNGYEEDDQEQTNGVVNNGEENNVDEHNGNNQKNQAQSEDEESDGNENNTIQEITDEMVDELDQDQESNLNVIEESECEDESNDSHDSNDNNPLPVTSIKRERDADDEEEPNCKRPHLLISSSNDDVITID